MRVRRRAHDNPRIATHCHRQGCHAHVSCRDPFMLSLSLHFHSMRHQAPSLLRALPLGPPPRHTATHQRRRPCVTVTLWMTPAVWCPRWCQEPCGCFCRCFCAAVCTCRSAFRMTPRSAVSSTRRLFYVSARLFTARVHSTGPGCPVSGGCVN
jgi:hypothetical protein